MPNEDERVLRADDALTDSQGRRSDCFGGTEVTAHAV